MDEEWIGQGGVAPYWPNFAEAMEMEVEFDTQINVSRDGTEQRVGWLPFPKTAVAFGSWARLGKLAAINDLRQTPNAKLVVPYFYRSVRLSTAADLGDTLLALSGDVPAWLLSGSRLILHGAAADEAVLVDFTGSGTATLLTGLLRAWPAGTRAYLAREAYRDDSTSFQIVNRRMGLAQKPRFDFDGRDVVRPITGPIRTHTIPGYLGFELFDFRANWQSGLTIKESPYMEEVESRHGLRAVYAPHRFYPFNRQEDHLLRTDEEVEQFTDFFMRHYGRQKRFFARTYQPKLPMSEVIYPDEPGPTGLDASQLDYYPRLYPFSRRGPDLFELTGSNGQVQLVDRMSIYAGERQLPVDFETRLFATTQYFPIISPLGPSRAHIEAGLVSLQFNVFCSYLDGTPDGGAAGGAGAQADLNFEVRFDYEQYADNRNRWDDVTRVDGAYPATVDHRFDYSVAQPADDPVGTLIDVSVSLPIPADTWFIRISLAVQPLGTGDDILTKVSDFRLVWGNLSPDHGIFETYQPITVPGPWRAEPYGLYRFDQDRLTVALRTGAVAESTVTLLSLDEPPELDE